MKRLIPLLLLFTIAFSASAQRFDGAIFVGFNLGQIDGDNSGHYTHFGMHSAVQTSFALQKNIDSPWRMII